MYQLGWTIGLLLGLILGGNGALLSMWTFDIDFNPIIGQANISTNQITTNSNDPQCNQYITVNVNGTLNIPSYIVNFQSDFQVSFYMRLSTLNFVGYLPILTYGCNKTSAAIQLGVYNGTLLHCLVTVPYQNGSTFYGEIYATRQGLNSWHLITIGKQYNQFLLSDNEFQVASGTFDSNVTFPNTAFNLTIGASSCTPNLPVPFDFDELQIYDEYYSTSDMYADQCVQYAPRPQIASVNADHTSANFTYYSFYAQFCPNAPNFTFWINGTAYHNSSNIVAVLPNETYAINLTTIWCFSSSPLTSDPIVLLPKGQLRHVWAFENELTDSAGTANPSTLTNLPNSYTEGQCGQAVVTANTTLTHYSIIYNLTDMTYQNDFTISFWMYMEGESDTAYAIIGQRRICNPETMWDLRYYSNALEFEFFTVAPPYYQLVTVPQPVPPQDFFYHWHYITITRSFYTLSLSVNGTTLSNYKYMNPFITYGLGLSEDPCMPPCSNPDGTIAAPVLLFDSLLIFDQYVDPEFLYTNPCIEVLAPPIVSVSSPAQPFTVAISPSPYEGYISVSYELNYQLNENAPIVQPCNSTCYVNRTHPTAYYYFWISMHLPTGIITSLTTSVPGLKLSCNHSDPSSSCPYGMSCTQQNFCNCSNNNYILGPYGDNCTLEIQCGDRICAYPENCTVCPQDCGKCHSETETCSVNNGNCDPRRQCSNQGGNITCGECSMGTSLNGSVCTLLCGDNVCEALYGENCVSCPVDCTDKYCDVCGDGFCDDTLETCHSCPEDCECSASATNECPDNCNSNGICNNGQCDCTAPWGGPSCKYVNLPIVTDIDSTSPIVSVSSQNYATEFYVSLRSLTEFDSTNVAVRSIELRDLNFTLATLQNTTYQLHTYNATLEYNAGLIVKVWIINETTSLSFGNQTSTFSPQTIKISVTITDWPFYTLSNYLSVVFDATVDATNNQKICVDSYQTDSGEVKWITIADGQTLLYGQFPDQAVIDGRERTTSYTLNSSDNSVSAIIPHFWFFAEIDPHYSVLVGDASANAGACHANKSDLIFLIEIIVPTVVGVLLLIILIVFGTTRLHACIVLKKNFKLIQMQRKGSVGSGRSNSLRV